jgi:hypothetical protein
MELELGDIILITAPKHKNIDGGQYLIEYIDINRIELLRDTGSKEVLQLENGVITNYEVEGFMIQYRQKEKGYARQNGLLPGKWVTIRIGGDVESIIHGKIDDLEEDMISVELYPDHQRIYLDFGYKGIPIGKNIESIELREPITDEDELIKDTSAKDESSSTLMSSSDTVFDKQEIADDDEDSKAVYEYADTDKQKDDMEEGDDILDGLIIEETLNIEVEELVDSDKRRVDLETQLNDMLEVLKSKQPGKMNVRQMNRINRIISRFRQLREQFSIEDEKNNRLQLKKRGPSYKPLVESFKKMENQLKWLVPVSIDKTLYCPHPTKSEGILGAYDARLNELDDWNNNVKSDSVPNYYSQLVREKGLLNGYESTLNTMDDSLHAIQVNNNIDSVYLGKESVNVVKRYNLGVKTITRENKVEVKTKEIIPNDTMYIDGFITLPSMFRQFSKASLPETSILQKSNLSQLQYKLSKVIKYAVRTRKNYDYSDVISDVEARNNVENMMKQVCEFSLRDKSVTDDSVTSKDKYEKLLDIMVPRTKDIISVLTNSSLLGATNMKEVLSELQPFLIYKEDLSFRQYVEIVNFLNKSINELNDKISADLRSLREINRVGESITPYESAIFALSVAYDEMLYSMVNARREMTDQEYLNTVRDIDGGRTLYDILALTNVDLYTAVDVASTVDAAISKFNAEEEAEEEAEKSSATIMKKALKECENAELAKMYGSIEELARDNGNPALYFDRQYDTTRYEMIDDYKTEQASMTATEFLDFIAGRLIENVGIPEHNALYEAASIIDGKRRLRVGNYAVVALDGLDDFGTPRSNRTEYYKWTEEKKWIKDDVVTNAMYDGIMANPDANMTALFCNVKDKCFAKSNNTCSSLDQTKKDLRKQELEDMKKMIDVEVEVKSRKIQEELTRLVEENYTAFKKKRKLKELIKHEHTRKYYFYGLETDMYVVKESPHARIRDRILGDNSDKMRQMRNILNFQRMFTQPPILEKGDSQYWYYCKDTQLKLLPTFLVTLANAYLNGDDVTKTYNMIIKEQGKQVDGSIVDIHSGYVIRMIDFDTNEGYTEEGFKIITKEVIEDKLDLQHVDEETFMKISKDTAIDETLEKKGDEDKPKYTADELALYESEMGKMIRNILKTLGTYIGIKIEKDELFIIREVRKGVLSVVNTKKIYDAKMEVLAKKGKKVVPYEQKRNQLLLLLTGIYYLIAIQTSIPHLKTKKTFPGCSRDFGGLPMYEGEEGMYYIACVMKKISSKIAPWDTIMKFKDTKILATMKALYEKLCAGSTIVQERITAKYAYMKDNTNILDDANYEHHIRNWGTFMPLLLQHGKNGELKRPIEITGNVQRDLKQSMKAGLKKGDEILDTIKGAIFLNSAHIYNDINTVVNRESALLLTKGGEGFLENACCQYNLSKDESKYGVNPLQYFSDKRDNINTYHNHVTTYSKIIENIFHMQQPYRLIENTDTKLKYPKVNTEQFSEETVYRAFIKYCRFNSGLPVEEHLKTFCRDNNSQFKQVDSIEDKIEILKSEGHLYTEKSCKALMRAVNRQKMVNFFSDVVVYDKSFGVLDSIFDNANLKILSLKDTTSSIQSLKSGDDMIDIINANTLLHPTLQNIYLKAFEVYGNMKTTNEHLNNDTLVTLNNDFLNYVILTNTTMKKNIVEFIDNYANNNRKTTNKIREFIASIDKFDIDSQEDIEQHISISYLKQMIYLISKLFPSFIVNDIKDKFTKKTDDKEKEDKKEEKDADKLKFSMEPGSKGLFKHLNISAIHKKNIESYIFDTYQSITIIPSGSKYGENYNVAEAPAMKHICRNIIDESDVVKDILYALPVFNDLDIYDKYDTEKEGYAALIMKFGEMNDDELLRLLFGYRNMVLLYTHYSLHLLSRYIHFASEGIITIDETTGMSEFKEIAIESNTEKTKFQVSKVISHYLMHLIKQKNIMNRDRRTILDINLRTKEAEKDSITNRLQLLSDEERKVDNELKASKLGKWSAGAQKGLFIYDEETYNKEVSDSINKTYGIVSGDNVDFDELAEVIEEETEAYDMSEITNDDDVEDDEENYRDERYSLKLDYTMRYE